jgi:hypothetical protein
MTHLSHYGLSADDCLTTLTAWRIQRPKEQLASLSVKRIEQHWYLEASFCAR